jgi:hypothetical protein
MDSETKVEMDTEMSCKKGIEVSVEIDSVNGPLVLASFNLGNNVYKY